MFDISFAELMIIAVIALLVIGPDKLPKLARTTGAYVGRLQRYIAQVKDEVNREVRFEELQNLQQEIKQGVHQAESSIRSEAATIEKEMQSATAAANKTPTKKSAVKKTAAKKTATKKAPAKKTTTKKTAAKTTKKPASKAKQ